MTLSGQTSTVLGGANQVIRYQVVYVDDVDLPPDQDWAIVETGAETFLFVKESRVGPLLLSRAWRSWQRLDRRRERADCLAPAGVVR